MIYKVIMMFRHSAGIVLICLLLQACGTKGPLYLPVPEQEPAQSDPQRRK